MSMNDDNREPWLRAVDPDEEGPSWIDAYRKPILAAAALVLVAFGGAIWYAYKAGGGTIGDAPLVHAPEGAVRHKPEDPGGLAVPDRDKLVYNRVNGAPGAEDVHLRPGPELPMDKPETAPADAAPASPEQVGTQAGTLPGELAMTDPLAEGAPSAAVVEEREPVPPAPVTGAAAGNVPAGSAPQAPVPHAAAPQTVPALVAPAAPAAGGAAVAVPAKPDAPKPDVHKADAHKAEALKAESKPETKPVTGKPASPKTASSGRYLLQLGAFGTEAAAEAAWKAAQKKFPAALGSLHQDIDPLARDGKTLYRLRGAGFADKAAADAACAQLKAGSHPCFVAAK